MSKFARLPLSVATAAVRTATSLGGHAYRVLRDRLPGADDGSDGRRRPPTFSGEAKVTPAPTPPPATTTDSPAARTGAPSRATGGGNGSAARASTGAATAVPQAPPPAAKPAQAPPPAAAKPEPAHVSREAVQVASVGPADDPGPMIDVQAPWDDYDRLPAAEVVSRMRAADPTTAAAVALYERRHKARRTVLAAAAQAG